MALRWSLYISLKTITGHSSSTEFEDIALVVWNFKFLEQLQVLLPKGFAGMVFNLIADVIGGTSQL